MAIDYWAVHRISQSEFLGKARERSVAWPRQDCMAMIKRETNAATTHIGRVFNRDHTTVLYSIAESNKRAGE